LNKNEPIEITAALNGFVVSGRVEPGLRQGEVMVFQSFAELGNFLKEHFTGRAHDLQSDMEVE
jgi:hypothetical protein